MADQKKKKKGSSQTIVSDSLKSTDSKNEKSNPPTIDNETQRSLKDTGASNSDQNNEEFFVGDIVWAKIGKYPYWPSIVCNDPDSKIYMKGTPKDKNTFSLHVRFCYDQGRRNWAKTVLHYSGEGDLLSKYRNALSLIKNNKNKMNIWKRAVNEADNFLTFDRIERWLNFSKKYHIKSPSPTPIKLPESKPSTSGTTSIQLPECELSTSGTPSPLQKYTDTPLILGNKPEGEIKKRKIIKPRKPKKKEPVFDFTYPKESFHIDINNDEHLIPTDPKRKVPARLIHDIEILEEEGIRKVKEWQASKH